MSSKTLKPRLGKGLEALIPKTFLASGKTVINLPITDITPNPFQPRLKIDEKTIHTLVESIKQHGVAQPILVRRKDDKYELIAGERRFRASQLAGNDTIPAIIREISDLESLQLALIENLEREDLNAIEVAKGYRRLIEEFDYTHQQLADQFGRSRSAITNTLRLLNLPDHIQNAIQNGIISEGHGRALLSLETEEEMSEYLARIQKEVISVRDLEDELANSRPETKSRKKRIVTAFKEIEEILSAALSTSVKITGTPKKGKITLKYNSQKQFEMLSQALNSIEG